MKEIFDKKIFIHGNSILMYVRAFSLEINIDEYYSTLKVSDNKDFLLFRFANLENTFDFIINEVEYSYSLAEIDDRYHGYNKQLRKNKTNIKNRIK